MRGLLFRRTLLFITGVCCLSFWMNWSKAAAGEEKLSVLQWCEIWEQMDGAKISGDSVKMEAVGKRLQELVKTEDNDGRRKALQALLNLDLYKGGRTFRKQLTELDKLYDPQKRENRDGATSTRPARRLC